MAIYPKNERKAVGQYLNEEWTEVAKSENFKKAIESNPSSIPAGGTTGQVLTKQDGTDYNTEWIDPSGGGLEGTNYIYVMADGTDIENAAELQAAYTTAQSMSPSATNRITIVCGPGKYNFDSSAFVMDTQYIDLVSLDGNRSVIFNSSNAAGTISITANDVFVKGVDVGTKNFTIADNLNLLKVENCKGGDWSFGGDDTFGSNPVTVSGTFVDCEGGLGSFGAIGTASGIFTDCTGANGAFGGNGMASGIFTNCTGGFTSFGGGSLGTASGTFTNCQGDSDSFGGDGGTASGTFNSCIGGDESFGGAGTASGTFANCIGGLDSFGGYGGTASGTFASCQGGDSSFGAAGTLNGKLYFCRLTAGTFETVSGGGRTVYCIDGNNNTNNQ